VSTVPAKSQQQWRVVAVCARGYAWAAPLLAVLGLLASLAEVLAVGLVVAFFYEAIGPGVQAAQLGGVAGRALQAVTGLAGATAAGLAAAVFVLVAGKALIRVLHDMLVAQIKHSITERARAAVYAQFLDVSYGYIQSKDRGDLLHVMSAQSWAVAEAFYCLARLGSNILAIALFATILLAISWQITLIAAVGAIVVFGLMRVIAIPARRLGEAATAENQEMSRQMLSMLQGMRTIRAYGQEAARKRIFQQASRRTRQVFVRMDQVCSAITPISEITYLGVLALIVWVAASSGTPFAATLACVALLYRLQPHLREFEGNLLALVRLAPPVAAVGAALERNDKNYPPDGSRPFAGLKNEIRFEDVWLTYEQADTPSLRGLNFSIRANRTTALIGPSGAGKTSIIGLLLRLYEPSRGRIIVDGIPLSDFQRQTWLRQVAVAGQDVELVDDTIAANIRLARPDATQQEIEQAARLAGIHQFIAALPDGYDSFIGTQGLNLSGGQRQRIGLARALICRPQLLILDEATNAVDAPLESEIRANIATAMKGGTMLIITHRLDSLQQIDHLVRIADGVIVESTTSPEPSMFRRRAS
jgi:ABC-type multidrug transport system fused ATPase/permease subunit